MFVLVLVLGLIGCKCLDDPKEHFGFRVCLLKGPTCIHMRSKFRISVVVVVVFPTTSNKRVPARGF